MNSGQDECHPLFCPTLRIFAVRNPTAQYHPSVHRKFLIEIETISVRIYHLDEFWARRVSSVSLPL
jgi:hypothetical protein